jgi:hypothetical protein
MADVEVRETIAAEPDAVYALVTDLPRMGQWSPENTGGRWLDGASGAAVGARFSGNNRKGLRRWKTTVTVTTADRGRQFTFDVAFAGIPISTWDYTLSGKDGGCEVLESWTDRRPAWMKLGSGPVMGVRDRAAHNRAGMVATLTALKAAAER